MPIHFTVEGAPKAKARHRSYINDGRINTYTPMTTSAWEQYIKLVAGPHAPRNLFEGPISLQCIFYMPIPKSWSKKKQHQASIHSIQPTVKPDVDNMLKLVKDALNGVIWKDDKQVVHVNARKLYSQDPRTEIFIEEIK